MDKPKTMTKTELESQIKREMTLIRRKNLPKERMEAEYRKFDNMYHACVLDGGTTTGPYIWREVYRRLCEEV